jgi:hypothetical protein
MPDTLHPIHEDLSRLSTEALAKRAHQAATGPYAADQRAMAFLSELARRVVALENERPLSREERIAARHRREIAAENATEEA